MRRIWFQFLVLHLFKQSSEKGWSGGHFLAKEGKAKEFRDYAWGKRKYSPWKLYAIYSWDAENNRMIEQRVKGNLARIYMRALM